MLIRLAAKTGIAPILQADTPDGYVDRKIVDRKMMAIRLET